MTRPEWLSDTLVGVIVGGLLTTIGQTIAQVLQIRSSKRARLDQVIAERQIVVLEEAHNKMADLRRRMGEMGSITWNVYFVHDGESIRESFDDMLWFIKARPLLPNEVFDAWERARVAIREHDRLEDAKADGREKRPALRDEARKNLNAATEIIRDYVAGRSATKSRVRRWFSR